MDFKFSKPTHIFLLILLILCLIIFIGIPIITFTGSVPSTEALDQLQDFPEELKFIFEIFTLILQITLVIVLFVIVPIIWYKLVNKLSIDEIISQIKLVKENLDQAIIWGIIGAALGFFVVILVGLVVNMLGVNIDDASNIKDLELFFSVPSMLILITLQPIAEEIFFRGFLIDKLNGLTGLYPAAIISSVLFGLAHLTYANIYPAIMTAIVGLILALLVIKTKNLYSAIIAHILFNVTSFVIYLIGKDLILEALIL
jgi:membrane protease YdiL (CAAX protease family)